MVWKSYLRISLIVCVMAFLIGSLTLTGSSNSEEKFMEPLSLEELFSLPSVSGLNVSWDQQKAAFYWDKTGRNELYVMDLKTEEMEQVTDGELPKFIMSYLVWSRDGSNIIFMKDKIGNEQYNIYAIDIKTGDVSQLTNTPKAQEYPVEFSPDDRWLSFCSTRNGQMNLFKMRRDGTQVTQLTYYERPAWGGSWQPNGEWIVYNTNEREGNLHNTDIYLVKEDGSEIKRAVRVSDDGSQDYFVDWSPDGMSFSFTSDANGVNQVGIYSLKSGDIKWLGNGLYDEEGGEFSPDGRWVLCIRNHEATVIPVLYNVKSGEVKEIRLSPGIACGTFALDGDHLIVGHTTPISRTQLLLYDLRNNTYKVLMPAEYGSIDPKRFVEPEYVQYKSFDGSEIPAILYHPKEVRNGEKLPAFIWPHGGPALQYFLEFSPLPQFFASKGYVVLLPNVRGSTGYGVEFRDACIKDWGGKDLKDVVAGAKFLKSLPYVDPDRIGIMGRSYGGFLTYLAITKEPDIWKAAVAWVGITDLPSLYKSDPPHGKIWLEEQMGNPEEERELWMDRSAVNFAQNLKAKLLMIQGVNDPRCPVEQARIFRDRILKLGFEEGKDFEYIEVDEGHMGWYTNIQSKIQQVKLIADFFDRNL